MRLTAFSQLIWFASIVCVCATEKPVFDWDAIQYVYAFGDSYSFVQGTAGHPNFSFIGDAIEFPFAPRELLTNEIIPKNTSSEGSNWLEFLTGCFEGRPSNCGIQLWNFAFAGADIDAALLPLHHDFTIPLVDQVKQWKRFASKILPRPPRKTLTTWWIGINDTGDTVFNTTISNFTAFWEAEITSYFNAVQLALDNGLTGAHLFINVPPEERSPATLGNSTKVALMKEHIDLFNVILGQHIDRFQHTHSATTVFRFDAHEWFNTVLDSPASFGFTNTTGFCTCLEPGFFWYNSGHPTERVHELLSEAIRNHLVAASNQ
ncbi:hypothetical protein HGRIS_006358 [Hohenbuehelia grisea]|uniref:Carbohydrate esterase family 16 protein n=1 Tax=Hohenbuehelia grisea TaxID=104357 RepID=A0ABR3K0W2_9AGAR